jgi:hypothetical protein
MAIRLVDTHLDLDVTDCANCAVQFAVPARLLAERRKDGQTFYCPNGHKLHFAETELDRVKKENERLAAQRTAAYDQAAAARADRDRADRSNRALRGVVTRERNRVGRGVCPCCNRTFPNLARHMAGQHPEHATDVPS